MAAAKPRVGPAYDMLRELLSDRGGKQYLVADELRVSTSTVSRWLKRASHPQRRHRQAIEDLCRSSRSRRMVTAQAHALGELEKETKPC